MLDDLADVGQRLVEVMQQAQLDGRLVGGDVHMGTRLDFVGGKETSTELEAIVNT